MNQEQDNDFTMMKQVKGFFLDPANAAKIALNPPLAAVKTKILAKLVLLQTDHDTQEEDTTGFTSGAKSNKVSMVDLGSAYGNAGSVYFKGIDDIATAAKLKNSHA